MPRKTAAERHGQPRRPSEAQPEVPPFNAIGIRAVAAAAPMQRRAAPRPRKVVNESTSWAVYLSRARGGVYLGHVEARDEADAREKAVKLYDIRESERFRLNVSPWTSKTPTS